MYEEEYPSDPYWDEYEFVYQDPPDYSLGSAYAGLPLPPLRVGRMDGMMFIALALVLFMGLHILADIYGPDRPVVAAAPPAALQSEQGGGRLQLGDPEAIAVPYDKFVLTQGLHGFSYGHQAIDIAAGRGATIKSPISGEVTQKFIDGSGNTVLVIENEIYEVMLLHGIYRPEIGDRVRIGAPIGEESNIGYTTDMQGRLCAGRNCGYHTHLNIVDKRVGGNVNPLEVLKLGRYGAGGE